MTIDRLNPVYVTIKDRFLLTKPGSSKQTYHIVLDLKDTPLSFKPGDSIGIYPQNDPILVEHLIEAMKAYAEDRVTDPKSKRDMTLWEFLSFKANLSRLTSSFLKLFYEYEREHDKKNDLHRLLAQENKVLLKQYLATHDPLSLMREYQDVTAPLQDLCAQFGPLLPRFYSVASSQLVHKEEVHLTVALFTFTHQDEMRYGVGSHFLCHLAKPHQTRIPIYVQTAPHFTLPSDERDIIMVGPGTGVAPYRSFLQERVQKNAPGKNWLFFGERNAKTDYFYQEEFEMWEKGGKLHLDLAFSRDQPSKIYVQDRMHEHARELWQWIQEGAYFYVCGDAQHMAKDVESMMHQIAHEQGQMSPEDAQNYVRSLRKQKRYLSDVY